MSREGHLKGMVVGQGKAAQIPPPAPLAGPWMYRGNFPLDRLPDGQFVRSAGDGTGACEVGNDEVGWTRYAIGDFVPGRKGGLQNESV